MHSYGSVITVSVGVKGQTLYEIQRQKDAETLPSCLSVKMKATKLNLFGF